MKKNSSPENPNAFGSIRLNKFLADCGVGSRRKADELIEEGKVQVNGKVVFELGVRVHPQLDQIKVSGKIVKQDKHKVYVMFNKPKRVLTSMSDPEGRPTIADYFRKLPFRIFPVGRLDWDTEGLILLTNDGEFAQKVTHPKNEIPKVYLAKLNGRPSDEQLNKLKRGVSIIGGHVKALEVQRVKSIGKGQYDWIRISITEGKNRQVKKMFEKIGFDVKKLQRIAIGELKIGSLERGQHRLLGSKEIGLIFHKKEKKIRPRSTKKI